MPNQAADAGASPVAIQGEEGSNSAAAARALLGDAVRLLPCDSFEAVFQAVDGSAAGRAVLPVENTTAGLIQPVWDRLLGITLGPELAALAEARVRITMVTAALPGARDKIRRLLAHPVAAAQCRHFVAESGWEVVPCHDTAGAARLVREGNDPSVAALCPPLAAEVYHLEVIAPSCGDSNRTWTRFLLLERGVARPRPEDDRTLLALTLPDTPGVLARALNVFFNSGLNLCALHSRAVPGRPGEYRFLLEVEVSAAHPSCREAISVLEGSGAGVRVLGSFRAPPWPEERAAAGA